MTCPDNMVCFTEEEWVQFVTDYELEIIDEVASLSPESTGDAQAVADFTWQVLFLDCFTNECISLLWFIHIRYF